MKNASNEVGDTFALTSQNDNGDITVSSGRNGETNLTGGRVRVDSSNGATEIDGMGVNITSTGNASVSAYTVSLNATNGNAKVEGSRGVNISSTNGDINLNPGGQGKAKVNGKEIATKDATVAFAGLYNEEEIDACDIPGNYGCNIQGGYSLFGTDFAIIVLSSGDDSTYRIQIGIKNDLSVIAARYGQAGSWGEWTEIGGGSSVEVVQTTGQSTTAVMSQKAVTDELAKKATKAELNLLNEGIMKDEGLYEDVDTYGEAYSRTSTNGEMMGYINHRIADYEVSTDDPSVFTYDGQMHVMKLAQFTLKPENNDLQFIEQNYRGVLIDPTWSYVNFVYSGMVKYFSANIGGGKCILSDAAGYTNNANYYIQLYAEACYGGSNGINVTIFAEYKLPTSTPDQNPLYINGSLEGYLRVWIV